MTHTEMTLSDLLEQRAAQFATHPALIYFDQPFTYAELHAQVNRAAAGFQALGLQPGDRVALMMPNFPQFVVAYFGALRAGAIVTATSPIYTPREATRQWSDAGAKILVIYDKLLPLAEAVQPQCPSLETLVLVGDAEYVPGRFATLQAALNTSQPLAPRPTSPITWIDFLRTGTKPRPVSTQPADVACLQYTGGTTGVSKGAMLTHANLVTNAFQTSQLLSGSRTGQEVLLLVLPLFHIYAMTCVMIAAIQSGSTIVMLPRFELEPAIAAIRKYRPTLFHGVPTMYVAFNNAPGVTSDDFKSLQLCMSGGAPLPVEVIAKFEKLTGGRLVEGFGLSETSPVTHVNPPSGDIRAGSIGKLIPNTEARIVDLETGTRDLPDGESGELVVRGPQVMKGYWNQPQATAEVMRDGWFYTGDIARRDSDGYYYIVDRKKDMIIAGGFNIYPRDVEEVLFMHPAVQEAVVVGVSDPYRGETVKAFIVPQPNAKLTIEEIVEHCRRHLAGYKVPHLVEFRVSLPKSGVGKYLRRELRQEAQAARSAKTA